MSFLHHVGVSFTQKVPPSERSETVSSKPEGELACSHTVPLLRIEPLAALPKPA